MVGVESITKVEKKPPFWKNGRNIIILLFTNIIHGVQKTIKIHIRE